ncbi:MAG: FxsA family protein [Verrucomicrobiales bacterium]|jgi:UPF0716 protein FxsA|nr:FxsA family protein [Verrucomicrobiales bacterium]
MFGRLLLLFIGIPVLELLIFLLLGSKIGITPTLAIIVITAILGAYLTKSQGLKALQKYQLAISEGRLPQEEVIDGVLILVAGAVLLTPGFLTDAIGFSLLIPPLRDFFKAVTKAKLKDRVTVVGQDMGAPDQSRPQSGPRVINVEAEVVDIPDPTPQSTDRS